jgi:hypothetical protein
VNDTLRKFSETLPSKEEDYSKFRKAYFELYKDTNHVVLTKTDGTFQIQAKKTDSLYFQSDRHIPQVYAVADLLQMKCIHIQLEPEKCIPYVRCNDSVPSKFYIFIGKKLNVTYEKEPYYCNVITMDSRFKARYKIVQQVYGDFSKDTISFTVFDHYGRPAFSKYENVLLFVSEYCGELYHEKYQYFELYKTVDGRWASPGDPYRYDNYHRKNIQAQCIEFADSVWFDVSRMHPLTIQREFPAPYYKIEGQKAIPLMGCYIEDLVRVKKEGVLKARKIPVDFK